MDYELLNIGLKRRKSPRKKVYNKYGNDELNYLLNNAPKTDNYITEIILLSLSKLKKSPNKYSDVILSIYENGVHSRITYFYICCNLHTNKELYIKEFGENTVNDFINYIDRFVIRLST